MSKIGILHPGEMGVSIAASAMSGGHLVYWVSTGRSEQTRMRATKQNLIELQSLSEFCQTCEVILSVCPPDAAEEVARSVIAEGFKGFYLDANAISPQRARKLAKIMDENKIRFFDGAIIGGPAWKKGETFLYLSGKDSEIVKDYFQNSLLETRLLGEEVGKASALKMCYASYSKGTTALLIAILATAETLGVREELYGQWDMDDPSFSGQVNGRILRSINKAWRFAGEMDESAATFQEAGLPSGFHQTAAEVFRRIADMKLDSSGQLDQMLTTILRKTA